MDNMYSTIFVFLFFLATVFCTTENPNDICNAGTKNSTCKRVTACAYALKLIDTRDIETITKLHCGFDGTHPKVCCPQGEFPIVYNFSEAPATNRPQPKSTLKPKVASTTARQIMEQTDTVFPSKAVCGKTSGVGDRIVGGTISGIYEHPWLARIAYLIDGAYVFGCAAALITDRYLLTAAHCVVKNIPVGIRLGEWNTMTQTDCYNNICNNQTVDVKISKVIVHPTFNVSKGGNADIALIKLEENVTFTEFIQPLCLPITKYIAMQDYSDDSVYFAAGWGQTELESVSVVKRQVQIKAAPIEVCRNIFNLKADVEPNIICAGGSKGKDTCRGDSGGPLVKLVSEDYDYNWYLFGITSTGNKNCGSEGIPGMYTRVSVYMDWIRSVVST